MLATLAALVLFAAPADDADPLQPLPRAVDACLRAEARVNPQCPEDVKARLVIDDDGVAREVELLDAALAARAILPCLQDAFEDLGAIFPAGPRRTVEVSLPRPHVITDAEPPTPRVKLLYDERSRADIPKRSSGIQLSDVVGRDISAPADPAHEVAAATAAVIGGVIGMGAGAGLVAVAFPEVVVPLQESPIPGIPFLFNGPLFLGGLVGASIGSALALIPLIGLRAAAVSGATAPLGLISGALGGTLIVTAVADILLTAWVFSFYVVNGSLSLLYGSTSNPLEAAIFSLFFGMVGGGVVGILVGAPLGAIVGAVAGPAWMASEVAE